MREVKSCINALVIGMLALIACSQFLAAGTPKGIQIISSDENGIELIFTPVINGFERNVTTDGKVTYIPIIEGAEVVSGFPGEPINLTMTLNITVPSPDGFRLSDVAISAVNSIQKIMSPYPNLLNVKGIAEPEYQIDNNKYRNHSPGEWAMLEYAGIGRYRHIARLTLTAARYNPDNSSIEIPEKLSVKISLKAVSMPLSLKPKDKYDPETTINHSVGAAWRNSGEPAAPQGTLRGIKNIVDKPQNASDWVKIEIDAEGIYKIDASQLSSMGVNIPASQLSTVKLYGNGGRNLSEIVSDGQNNQMNEQPIIIKKKAGGDLESIIFYAAGTRGFEYRDGNFHRYIHWYSKNNYYMLTWGGTDGKRAEAIDPPSSSAEHFPVTYTHRIFEEEELNNPYLGGAGRTWLGRTFFTTPIVTLLPNLDRSGKIFYRFSLGHRSDKEGVFSVTENTEKIKSLQLFGVNLGNYEHVRRELTTAELPANKIGGDNRSVLKFEYKSIPEGYSAAVPYLDYLEIHYPRSFAAIDNSLGFFSDPSMSGICEYRINEFGSGEIIGFDVTDPKNPKLLKNLSITGGLHIFKDEQTVNNPKKYFLSGKLLSPKLEKTSIANLRANLSGYDVIVITHKDLLESAKEFASYRESASSLTVLPVTTEHIYNEFAGGVPDITAIRDYIAFTFQNWQTKPKYVVLWGDGHYDYKNIQSNTINYVPAYVSLDNVVVFDEKYTVCSDDFYGCIVGNDNIMDIALGRLPIDSPDMGFWMVEKIKHYESEQSEDAWRTLVTLCADDGLTKNQSSDGSQYTDSSDVLARSYVPDDMQIKTIYIVEYPTETAASGRLKPRANQDILLTVNNNGTMLLNWVGHGNPQVWAHESVLERETTLPQMSNLDKLFFCVAATCDFARFDKTDTRSAAEEMVLSKTGGGIGVISATRVVFSSQNANMNKSIYTHLFKLDTTQGQYPRLGDMWYSVKQSHSNLNDRQYVLLADPTLRLLMPGLRVEIDSVNGVPISEIEGNIELKALSNVRIACRIVKPGSKETDLSFNGIASVNLYDGDQEIKIRDEMNTLFAYMKFGGALNRSSYPVTNGSFSTNFIIPKDISFNKANGRFFIYSYSDDGRFAKGSTRRIIVNGIDVNAVPDEKGPDIKIFLDSRAFKEGDVVRNSPLLIVDLFDESGINSTGLGIGHRIEAWLDDNPISYDFTDRYTTSLTDSRFGTAQDFLPNLMPGMHRVKVRAWDVYNNFSVAETFFNISDNNKTIVMSGSYTYPNPFLDRTTIVFYHNAQPPVNAEVNIYTTAGVHLRTINQTLFTSYQSDIIWDGFDSQGNRVLAGAYMYSISLVQKNGKSGWLGGGPVVFIK